MDLSQRLQSDLSQSLSQIDFPQTAIIVSFSHVDPLSGFVFCLHGLLQIHRGPRGPNPAESSQIGGRPCASMSPHSRSAFPDGATRISRGGKLAFDVCGERVRHHTVTTQPIEHEAVHLLLKSEEEIATLQSSVVKYLFKIVLG